MLQKLQLKIDGVAKVATQNHGVAKVAFFFFEMVPIF